MITHVYQTIQLPWNVSQLITTAQQPTRSNNIVPLRFDLIDNFGRFRIIGDYTE
jgi:hypothetical protein